MYTQDDMPLTALGGNIFRLLTEQNDMHAYIHVVLVQFTLSAQYPMFCECGMLCVAVCCSVLQCVAVCCAGNVLLRITGVFSV